MSEKKLTTRREFCQQVYHGAAAAMCGGVLSTLLQSCGSSDPASSSGGGISRLTATLSGGQIALAIDASSPLASVGSAALVQASNTAVLVSRTAQDTFVAVSAICTHQSCTITNFSNSTYTCPCHGSQFNTNGQVTKGPANSSLKKFQTSFANNQLIITVT